MHKLSEKDIKKVNAGGGKGEIDYDLIIGECCECHKIIYGNEDYGYRDEIAKKGLLCKKCLQEIQDITDWCKD